MITQLQTTANEIEFNYGAFSFLAYKTERGTVQVLALPQAFAQHVEEGFDVALVDTFAQARVAAVTFAEAAEFKHYGITNNWCRSYEIEPGIWCAEVIGADGGFHSKMVDYPHQAQQEIKAICSKLTRTKAIAA